MPARAALATGIVLLAAAPAAAETRWETYDAGDAFGAGICPRDGTDLTANFACFMVECAPGGGLRYVVNFAGGEWTDSVTARVTVDGESFPPLDFARVPAPDYRAHSPHRPAEHDAMLAALRAGAEARIAVTDATGRSFDYLEMSLAGSSRTINQVQAACPERAEPTPETAADRFVPSADHGPESAAVLAAARAALSDTIATTETDHGAVDVYAAEVAVEGARRLVLVDLCNTRAFGMAGCTLVVLAAEGDAPLTEVTEIGGGSVVWIDTEAATEGWPDLILQGVRGVDRPYARWRWDGAGYAHAYNFE
jgi:hypothetical protein